MTANLLTAEDRERHEKLSNRIAGLIAKAEGTKNQHEAEAFMAKAEELMLRHAIDRAELASAGKITKEQIIRTTLKYRESNHWWPVVRQTTFGLVDDIGLTGAAVYNAAKCFVLYGTKDDCEHVRQTVESVWRQAVAHMTMWRKLDAGYNALSTHDQSRWVAREDFIRGFIHGYGRVLRERRDRFTEQTTGAELVFVGRKKEIEESMAGLGTTSYSQRGGWSRNGYSAGVAAGRDSAAAPGVGTGTGRAIGRV